jgi:hypothetical protein
MMTPDMTLTMLYHYNTHAGAIGIATEPFCFSSFFFAGDHEATAVIAMIDCVTIGVR